MSAALETPEEDPRDLRGEVRKLKEDGKSYADMARESGVAMSTFSAWVGGTYAGNSEAVAGKIARWLDARVAQAQAKQALPAPIGFLPTPTAAAFTGALSHAQFTVDIVVIAGGAGVGKTMACEEYRRTRPNVWLLTGEPCLAASGSMLRELAEVMGINDSPSRLSRAICARLRDSDGLLIVDEAQHFTTGALDQLRSIHDLAGVGLALVGNETVHARLEGTGRQAQFAQIFSRVGMRLARVRPLARDIAAVIDAWGIAGTRERHLLGVIARKPGALRVLNKVLRVAHMLAGAAGAELGEAHIVAAWNRLANTKIEEGEA
jgi:DNA transposition AAA+ family ATPase